MSAPSPEEKPLQTASLVVHSTRGLIRDRKTRRKTMLIVMAVALVLLFSGSTFLQSAIDWHEHPVWFIVYWIACGWLALTAILLAIFDLLMVRLDARNAERGLRQDLKTELPGSTINE